MTFLTRHLTAALCAGLACASANAVVIDFDSDVLTTFAPNAPFMTSGDALTEDGFYIATSSTKTGANTDDLVGLVVNGSDSSTCFNLICPSNNNTNYLAAVNDGLPFLQTVSGKPLTISSFSAAFVAAANAAVPTVPLLLRVYGFVNPTTVFYEDVLPTGLTNGKLQFNTYSLSSTFASRQYTEVDFYGYACDATGDCVRTANTAQFALDNINVTVAAVPEPTSYLMMVLGLAGIGAVARYRARTTAAA